MIIRKANEKDIPQLNRLLRQVLMVHHKGRPDLFRAGSKKFTDEQLQTMLLDPNTPVFVAVDARALVVGYVFCQFQRHDHDSVLTDIKTLYIEDLCVDETKRGSQIGKTLLSYVSSFAKNNGCYNIALNVWTCNQGALAFYEKCGLVPQKIGLEKIL
ncbi:MAG: GNAT family N-acetyltransferase [Clostridiales bacterium]|nr:GNAT family N-acetyltransferase [Clostridiales bacterium]